MTKSTHPPVWPSPALLTMPDGRMFQESAGGNSYLVAKYDGQVALWITSLHDPQTNFVQTQVSLSDPLSLNLPYMQAMTLGLLWANPPDRICLLGLGGGAMARVLHHHLTGSKIDCVELSATVLRCAKEFFGLIPDDRLVCHLADAADFLRYSGQSYDLILIDVFADKGRIPKHLGTPEFFALCKNRLSAAGVVVMNISSLAPDHVNTSSAFRAAFDHVAQLDASTQTTIWFGSSERPWRTSTFTQAAHRLQRTYRFHFPFAEWAGKVEVVPALSVHEVGPPAAANSSGALPTGERESGQEWS